MKQDYTSPTLPEHIHDLLEDFEFRALDYAEKRPNAEAARLIDAARVRLRSEIADILRSLEDAENITTRDAQGKTAGSVHDTDQIWEDVRATASLIHDAAERALDLLGPGDGKDGLPDWKEVAAALVRVKYHAETLRLDCSSAEKVKVSEDDPPITEEEANEARVQVVNMGLKGGFTPEAIASWSSGALIPELKRRGLLPEFDLSDLTGEAAQ